MWNPSERERKKIYVVEAPDGHVNNLSVRSSTTSRPTLQQRRRVFSRKYGLVGFHVPRVSSTCVCVCARVHTRTRERCIRWQNAYYARAQQRRPRVLRDLRYRAIINLSLFSFRYVILVSSFFAPFVFAFFSFFVFFLFRPIGRGFGIYLIFAAITHVAVDSRRLFHAMLLHGHALLCVTFSLRERISFPFRCAGHDNNNNTQTHHTSLDKFQPLLHRRDSRNAEELCRNA